VNRNWGPGHPSWGRAGRDADDRAEHGAPMIPLPDPAPCALLPDRLARHYGGTEADWRRVLDASERQSQRPSGVCAPRGSGLYELTPAILESWWADDSTGRGPLSTIVLEGAPLDGAWADARRAFLALHELTTARVMVALLCRMYGP
jgi:hypothetical protein